MKLKKLLAGLLAAALTVTSLSEFTVGHAVSVANAGYEPPAALTAGDMKISGANSFGDMVARELSVVSAEQAENNGCNVFSVEMEGNTAKVSFETLQDCSLVVAIYDNEGEGMIGSGYAEVSKDETEAEVKINAELPEYFYIRAYLVNSDTLRPLSTEYSSPMYTREMREFLSKTADDFDPERVLNLDNDPNTNFAVFSEDTVLAADSGDKNVLVSADEKTLTYVFGNPDGSIASLSAGDVFAYDNDGELIILKVASVSTDKKSGNVTVVGEEAELEEVFEHLRIDGDVNSDNAVIDDSHMDEGVTCYGLVDDKEESGISPQAFVDVTGKSEKSINFNIWEKKIGIGEFSADLNLKIGASTKVYLSFSEVYVEFKLDLVNKISFEFEITINALKKQMRLAYIAIYICPGVYFSVTPEFVLELSGKASIEGTFSVTVGFKASSKSGIENLSSAPKFTAKGGIEVTIFFGFLLNPALSVVHEKLFNLSLETKSGVEITAKLEASTDNIDPTCIHECDICIDGEINGKFSLDITIKLLDSNRLKFSLNLLEISVHIADFYISPSFGEFAFTKCPHYKYQTFLTVKDKENAYIDGVNVVIDNNDLFEYTTKGKEELELWLTLGKHKVELDATNYKPKSTTINVKEGGEHFTIKIEKDSDKSPSNVFGTAIKDIVSGKADTYKVKQICLLKDRVYVVTDGGMLYAWGSNKSGQLGNNSTDANYTPQFIMSDVDSVTSSVSGHATGAVTKSGGLYTWGNDRYGMLGNSNNWIFPNSRAYPKEIMDGIQSAYFKGLSSSAISKDGSLYVWGYGYYGEVGNGSSGINVETTPQSNILNDVLSVEYGDYNFCVLTKNGTLYTWGMNGGQLGDGATANRSKPYAILNDVVSFAFGEIAAVAVTRDGSLYTWGKKYSNGNSPVKIGDGIAMVFHDYNYAAAIAQDGSLYTWHIGSPDVRTKIEIPGRVISYTALESSEAAITENGDLYMWGYNSHGELGDGTTNSCYTPKLVKRHIDSVYADGSTIAAVTKDGELYMWGDNSQNLIVVNNEENVLTPTKINLKSYAEPTLFSAHSTLGGLLNNEIYNIYSVNLRGVENPLSPENLLYIGQGISDENGILEIPEAALEQGTIFVKAMCDFSLPNAEIASAEANSDSVMLSWEAVENADEYKVYCYNEFGIVSETAVEGTTATIEGLEKGNYYGFIVSSFVYGEQSVPIVDDMIVIETTAGLLGDVNGDQKVNDQDSILLSRYLSEWGNEIDLYSADMNGDGKVNDQDSIVLARTLAGWYE